MRQEQVLLQRGQGGHAGVTTDVSSSSVAARVERHKVNVQPLVATGHFIGKKNKLHTHGSDGAQGHGGPGAVPRQPKDGEAHQRAMVAGDGSRLQSFNLKLGDPRLGQGGGQGGDSCGLRPHQRHGMDRRSVQLHLGHTRAIAECHKRHLASAEGFRVKAASDDAGGHLIITYVKLKKFSATSKNSGVSKAAVA
jgi:hypothetical protein